MSSEPDLEQIHSQLGHPGVRRLLHFMRIKHLPFSTEEVERTCSRCRICAKLKPRFHTGTQNNQLIKAVLPWQRISIDFKGPVSGKRRFLLIVVDEYSRFPFVFPCANMTSETVMNCLTSLFCLVGLPEYVHSDRSMSFLSRGLNDFLLKKGIATSKTTPYHPTGNSQCERINQTVWKTIKLLLAERSLPESAWELVLPDALHSIRSLLCTSTNSTPHDRFFCFQRRSMNGASMPDWLFEPGPVLLRRFVRDKSEPLCDQVDLIEANPKYALIRYPNGRESTVSVTDLAPFPKISSASSPGDTRSLLSELPVPEDQNSPSSHDQSLTKETSRSSETCEKTAPTCESAIDSNITDAKDVTPPRRSSRISKPPDRYGEWVSH